MYKENRIYKAKIDFFLMRFRANNWGSCSTGGRAVLLIEWLAVQSLPAPVNVPNILGQDTTLTPSCLSIEKKSACVNG